MASRLRRVSKPGSGDTDGPRSGRQRPRQESAWNTYALAAYLLVDNGVSDYYLLSAPSSGADRSTIYFSIELAALGAPTAAFTLTSGVYSRAFLHGLVTLNTTNTTASITVS
jgi:hypothetical protein